MKSTRRARLQVQGLALLTVLLVMVFLGLYIASVTVTIDQNLRSGPHEEKSARCRYASEAGLRRALMELGQFSGFHTDGLIGEVMPGSRVGYRVKVVNNYGNAEEEVAPDGTTIPPGLAWIESVALYDGEEVPGQTGMARRLAGQGKVEFEHLVHGRGVIHFGSPTLTTIFCSFDSTIDSPPWAPNFIPTDPATYHRQVTIRAESGMNLTSTALDGDAYRDSADTVYNSNSDTVVTGSVGIEPKLYIPTRFREPEALRGAGASQMWNDGQTIAPGRYGLVMANGHVMLEPGEYCIDTLYVGNSVGVDTHLDLSPAVTPDNPCIIYVRAQVEMVGAGPKCLFGSLDRSPSALRLYFTADQPASCYLLMLEGNGTTTMSGVMAGEYLLVWVQDQCKFYGAIQADRVYWGESAALVYDLNLREQEYSEEPEWLLLSETDD